MTSLQERRTGTSLIELTDDDEDIGEGRGLEERGLPRHLAPELAAGGEVHVPQNYPRLC